MSFRENQRIILLSLAILGLLATGALLMIQPASRDEEVRTAVLELIEAFEDRNIADFLDGIRDPVNLGINNDLEHQGHAAIHERLRSVYDRLAYIDVRPQEIAVTAQPDGDSATVVMPFHWTVANVLYPNARTRSEGYNPNGEPEEATLVLLQQDGQWILAEVYLALRSR